MKKNIFCCLVILLPFVASAQQNEIPRAYLKDSLASLVEKSKDLLEHAYMAQKLLAVTDTLPDWQGFPVKLYEYQTGADIYTGQPKTGKVYLLNPTPEKLAMWIITTCWEVKKTWITNTLINYFSG